MQLSRCRMTKDTWIPHAILAVLLLLALPAVVAAAAPAQDFTTTYTITVREDGSALWQVEYRTPLMTDADTTLFEEYRGDLNSIYLPQVQELMAGSASQASVAAGRPMTVGDVSGSAVIQVSPTGKYGIVVYSFDWNGFAKSGDTLAIGDAFAGGLFLAKDSTLIIRYPDGYTVLSVEPAADQQRDSVIWYGQRSFAAGEPRVVLERAGVPVLPIAAGIIILLIITGIVVGLKLKRRCTGEKEVEELPALLSADEQKSVEERIVSLLTESHGERFQSEIVRMLGLPRSTVSSAVGSLHQKGIIQKVRKGRENLIRLVKAGNNLPDE